MRPARSLWQASLAVVVTAACAAPAVTAPSTIPLSSPSATESTAVEPSPSPGSLRRPHVFVIVMENTSFGRALAAPAIGSLASRHGLATNYHAVARPSLPNYLAMTSGSTHGVRDNAYHALPQGGIGAQLDAAGIRWRAYYEGLTAAGCMQSRYPYALNHNPFAYYGGKCPENVVPFEALEADLVGDTPHFVWIKPDACHDGHDCALSIAGPWLVAVVDRILGSRAFRDDGVLFVAWDEGDGSDGTNHVPLIVVTPESVARRSDVRYDHYSLLATIEDLFGLPRLGEAAGARPLTDLLSPRRP
jgi:hypothetical protein